MKRRCFGLFITFSYLTADTLLEKVLLPLLKLATLRKALVLSRQFFEGNPAYRSVALHSV